MTLGKRLKEERIEKGISLEKLKGAVGISTSNLGDYENDSKNPTIDRLLRIAEFYGVSLDYLAGRTEIKSPEPTIRAICDATGLSEDAVRRLRSNREMMDIGDDECTIGLAPHTTATVEMEPFGKYLNIACEMLSILISHKSLDFESCLRHLHAYMHPNSEDGQAVINSCVMAYKALTGKDMSPEDFKRTLFRQQVFSEFQSFFEDIKKAEEVRHGNNPKA